MGFDQSVPKLEEILPKLAIKFSANVTKSLALSPTALEPIEIKARAVALLGEVIRKQTTLSEHQSQLCLAFDEVFADLILAAYLAAACLDNPARIVLRRCLETGIAIAYLWDSPCTFYGWASHDEDLNFRAMLEFLRSDGYRTLLMHQNSEYKGEIVIDQNQAELLYREFSNATHGKWTTFEAAAPSRFSHNPSEWMAQLTRLQDVEDILLKLWRLRFPIDYAALLSQLPALATVEGKR